MKENKTPLHVCKGKPIVGSREKGKLETVYGKGYEPSINHEIETNSKFYI